MQIKLNSVRRTTFDTACALIVSLLILSTTMLAADGLKDSTFFRQSKFATAILSEDSMSIKGILEDPGKTDMFYKFVGAVTAAYINFEMIPVNEAKTFAVIFESLGEDISVESFAYQGKKLIITGSAPDVKACGDFRKKLETQKYFESVNLHQYTTVDDNVHFEMICNGG